MMKLHGKDMKCLIRGNMEHIGILNKKIIKIFL